MIKITSTTFAFILLFTGISFAHGGGTDKCGCHYNRDTGLYHCHTRKQIGGDCPPENYISNKNDKFNSMMSN